MTRFEVELEGLRIAGEVEVVGNECRDIKIDRVRLARIRPCADPEPLGVLAGRVLVQAWLAELILNSGIGRRLEQVILQQQHGVALK